MSLEKKVINLFKEINGIPRCSGNEKQISDWLTSFGKQQGWETIQDEVGNVILKVPSKNGYANKPTIILQGHMDMVCVREEGSNHDFCKDPIFTYEEDGWLKAKGTTLGADNGIAVALALAIATENDIAHPPLELLFTVDEERGLTGAKSLKPDVLTGKFLLNIDSDCDGVFTIGCAGGKDTLIKVPLTYDDTASNIPKFEIAISNLSGGHSGTQIKAQKPNAIQLIARILNAIVDNENQMVEKDFRICSMKAGVAHNAIPTNASVIIATNNKELVLNTCDDFLKIFKKEFGESEPEFTFNVEESQNNQKLLNYDLSRKIVKMLIALPHGVFTMNKQFVETSNNLATINCDETLNILLSHRSNVESKLDFLINKVKAIADLAGAEIIVSGGYPHWEPNWDSEILKKSVMSYKNVFDAEPRIEVIHAGLECGVIGAKYPGMEMISFGPTIKAPHTPKERLKIDDIKRILDFLVELFKNI